MTDELDFQKDIRSSVLPCMGWAEVISHRFKKGLPDLGIKLINAPMAFVECKMIKLSAQHKRVEFDIELTELQRLCLRKMKKAGLTVGVFIKVVIDKQPHRVYVIKDIERETFTLDEKHFHKSKSTNASSNNKWPVTCMIEQLTLGD